jgi:hypothetical protein
LSEDPIFKKEIVWTEIIPEIESHIRQVPDARKALATLVIAGCDRERILRYLYLFLGGSPDDAKAVKKGFSRCRAHVSVHVARLKNLADEDERIEGILRYAGLLDLAGGTLTEAMRHRAEFLSLLGKTIIRDMSSGRFSGREKHFVLLAKMVREVTGRPRYREIGELADAIGMAYDPQFKHKYTAQAVEKLYSRHDWVKTLPKKRRPRSSGH